MKENNEEKKSPSAESYDWEKIRSEYVSKKITYSELCGKYGCSMSVLSKKASAEKWREKRKKHRKKVERKTEEKLADREAEKNARDISRCNDAAYELLEKIFQAINELNTIIIDQTVTEKTYGTDENGKIELKSVEKHKKKGKQKGNIRTEDIKRLTAAVKDIKEILGDSEGKDNKFIIEFADGVLDKYGS